jgi:hypothetical protein
MTTAKTMTTFRTLAAIAALGAGVGGCARLEGLTGGPSAPAPQPAAVAPAPTMGTTPTVMINAPAVTVREVLVSRARSRGASPTLTAAAVVIQRELPSTNEALAAACGPHRPGRAVRVVLGTEAAGLGTRVTEQRYIVDGTNVCPLPLNEADANQAVASLNEVKAQAESRVARR